MDLRELSETAPEVAADDTLAAVLGLMSEQKANLAAVLEGRKFLGMIGEPDIARHGAIPELDVSPLRARDVMTATVETMLASTPVIDAARVMRERRLQYLALMDEQGDFVGMVTLRRVLFEVMDELDLKVDNLERELMADGPGG